MTPRPDPAPRRPRRPRLPLPALPGCALALAVAVGTATAAEPAASPGRALAQKQGCLGCHAVDTQLVGPAYKAVAERYREHKDAAAELARRIRAGGSGTWGPMAMPPQAQLSEADARRLATWILAGAK